jgi:isocitrate dehydrogenase
MTTEKRITVARGDGIGPEIMDATLRILEAAKAPLAYDFITIGEPLYLDGHTAGLAPESWDTLRTNRVFLKAPITTPLGGGFKSLNVTVRKSLNLFANVRPTQSYAPYVGSAHPDLDLVIVRENEEDLYAGIEHRQTEEVTQVLKLITRPGSERIIRYAFEYARAYGREKVACMTKNNIMKLTDGLFGRVFEEVKADYPDIEAEHHIIDIGAARMATQPERFDVVVTLNLYGDILSDIASQVAGSVGLAGSANIGDDMAMFEAVHGSAPDIAGQDIANPSGLLVAATQMLVHLGEAEVAETIRNAWLTTLESGLHTADVYRPEQSEKKVGTQAFADAVIERLGQTPAKLSPVVYRPGGIKVTPKPPARAKKELRGVDAFLDWSEGDRHPDRLGAALEAACPERWRLKMITNRGVKVYPDGLPETFCTDHWRCRLVAKDGRVVSFDEVLELLGAIHAAGLEVIKTEHLYTFDGQRGYSLGQGE